MSPLEAAPPSGAVPLRLAVLLCNYNDATRLPRALDAIFQQSRLPDEVVIVDDGSVDDSPRVIAAYAAAHPQIRVITHPKNRGVVAAGITGFQAVTSEFVYWASSNDHVLPGFFARAMELAGQHPNVGALLGQVTCKNSLTGVEDLQGVRAWNSTRGVSPAEFRRDYLEGEHPWFSLGPSCIYRRAALIEAGGIRPELGAFSDSFAVRAMGLAHGVGYVAQPCALFFTGGKSYSDKLYFNPAARLDVVARAAWLMRSPPCREIFPEEYVRAWVLVARQAVLAELQSMFETRIWEGRCRIMEQSKLSSGLASLLVPLFRLCASGTHYLGRLILALRVKAYRGDVSCFTDSSRPQ
jgi:hypothetical protein